MTPRSGEPRPERLRIAALRSALAGPFDLSLAPGECVAVTGASGSGKSLFLRMIADLDPSTGEVFLDGAARQRIAAPAWRRQVVYCPAESGWWDERVAAHFPGPSQGFARSMGARFGLDPGLLDGPVLRLSSGERQRLALIRALALEPPALLLDEPTGALDQDSTALVETVLRERLAAGSVILMVTHSDAQAERLAGRHLRMAARRLVGS
ncbi:MAG TPA: ATP-binding cassette domain-containing protein [Acetobacteraceae bacterium]|jgi:ABC-type iron transport system FetAB ATPase subunit